MPLLLFRAAPFGPCHGLVETRMFPISRSATVSLWLGVQCEEQPMRALSVVALLLGLAAGLARAEMVDLETCTDATGRTVPGVKDPSLKVLVRSGVEEGRRVIRYNPDLLPELSTTAKQFFFAQECARLSLGETPGAELTASRVQQADCVGVGILQASAILNAPAAIQALQAELIFSDDEWARLPGPRRQFDLTACPRRTGIALPAAMPPTAKQVQSDACIRQCGDRLFRCQGGCRGADCNAGCLDSYDHCDATCRLP